MVSMLSILSRPARAGSRLVFLLLLLVSPFAVIHDSADGWAGGGSNFNQVEPGLAGHAQRIGSGHDANLLFFIVDEPNRRNADLFVVTEIRRNGLTLLKKLRTARRSSGHTGVDRTGEVPNRKRASVLKSPAPASICRMRKVCHQQHRTDRTVCIHQNGSRKTTPSLRCKSARLIMVSEIRFGKGEKFDSQLFGPHSAELP